MDYVQRIAEQIAGGTLGLICPTMELLVAPAYREVALSGTGVIRADDRGILSFKLVSPITGRPHDVLTRPKQPGELYHPGDHVMLRAIDHEGREWRSDWVIVRIVSILGENWIVRQTVDTLFSSDARSRSAASVVRLYVPRMPRLPFDLSTETEVSVQGRRVLTSSALNRHRRVIGDAQVEFREHDRHWLVVDAKKDGAFVPDWAGLLCNAIEFASALRARPALAVREFEDRSDLGIFSGPFLQHESYLPPPVLRGRPDTASIFWSCVEKALTWLSGLGREAGETIEELSGIRRGASGSLQTACLTLAVGIESLARRLLPMSQSTDSEDIEKLIQHVKKWSGDRGVRERAENMIGQMKHTRPVDALYRWANHEGVPKDLVRAWKRLRDPKAHGKAPRADQELLDAYHSCAELFHRLMAWAMQYDGPILRTSERNWGLQDAEST